MKAVDRSRLPELGPDPVFRFPAVERQTLGNGLRVWTVEHRDVPVVAMVLLLATGAAEDPDERSGVAALTADMLDEGSGERSALDIESAFARLGTQLDTEIGADLTLLSALTLSRFRDETLSLVADVVRRPRIAEEDFARVRELRLNRLLQLNDMPSAVADRTLTRLLYPGHPYGHLPIGSPASLRACTVADVREFHRRAWKPWRLTLILVGDASHADLLGAAERAFGDWSPAPDEEDGWSPREVTVPLPRTSPLVALVHRPGAAQSELRVGQVSVPRHTPDYHALILLNAILGGQFVSRLNMNLREQKGYTYGVRSGFDFRKGPGPFLVQAAVQTRATAHAVQETLDEIAAIGGSRPPTPEEMELARLSVTRGYPRNFETAGQIARGLVQLALFGLADDTFERFVPCVEQQGVADVTAAAGRLNPGQMVITAVGDREQIFGGLAGLGLGEPQILEADQDP
ncbi:MAG TPA: pitrilysin family protein [Vicinamibacterales bacterium]|nr:pitrilysin family protein [Vicinamibacterales bacterium]